MLNILKENFKKFEYKKHGKYFFKCKNETLIIFQLDFICNKTVLRIELSIIPFLCNEKVIPFNSSILSDMNKGYFLHGLKDEYQINFIPKEQLSKITNEISCALLNKILPYFESFTIEDKFIKKYIYPYEKYRKALFEIKYFKDFEKAKSIIESIACRSKNENDLLNYLISNDIKNLNNLILIEEQEFLLKNKFIKK